jgi:hypothetical protein
MRLTRVLYALCAATALGSAACSDSATEPELALAGPEYARVAGTYALSHIVGEEIPWGFQSVGGGGVVFRGGTLTLGGDGRFALHLSQTWVSPASGAPELRTAGRYVYSPGDSSFTVTEDSTNKTARGTVRGRVVVLPVGGAPFTFVRR